VASLLTDNQIVATAAQEGSLLHNPGHWSLRPILADLAEATRGMHYSIIKIGREANKVADKLAKQARQAPIPSSCLYSCEALGHSQNCIVQMALQNFQ